MTPGFLTQVEMKGLDRLLGCLLRRESRPFVTPAPAGVLGLVQVSLGLAKLAKPVL